MNTRLSLPEKTIVRLYEIGWTIRRLAGKYYASYGTIRVRLKEAGVLRSKPIIIKRSEIAKRHRKMTYKEIAQIYGVCERTIRRKMKGE